MFFKKIITLICLMVLGACDGGQDATENIATETVYDGATGRVSVAITDDLSANYSEVWVSLFAIEATHADGKVVTLFDNAQGLSVNLAELSGVGDLLTIRDVPVGSYQSFRVVLGRELKLVTLDGQVQTRDFAPHGNAPTVTIAVKGQLEVAEDGATSFALDFDLQAFRFDNAGNVVPTVVFIQDISQQLRQTIGRLQGEVTAVDADGFMLKTEAGIDVRVKLNAIATLLYEDGVVLDQVDIGMYVKVCGAFDAASFTLEAIKVVMQSSAVPVEQPDMMEVEGNITALTDNGFTLDIKHADYLPETDDVDVLISAATRFIRGDGSQLEVGRSVAIKAMRNEDGSVSALVVEIEGAGVGEAAPYAFGIIEGEVVDLVNDTLTVLVRSGAGSPLIPGTTVAVNIADTFIKSGNRQSLVAGVSVTLKGVVISDVLHPVLVVVNGAAGDTVLVKGVVVNILGTQVTLQVTASDNSAIAFMDEISFDISGITISGADGAAGVFQPMVVLDVVGRLAGNGNLIPLTLTVNAAATPDGVVCTPGFTINGTVSALGVGSISVLVPASGAGTQVVMVNITNNTVFTDGVSPALDQEVSIIADDCLSGIFATTVTAIVPVI